MANYALLIWDGDGTDLGDTLMAFCPNCSEGIVPRPGGTLDDPNPYMGFCMTCKKPFKVTELSDMKLYRSTMDALASTLEKFFVLLGHNSDVYVKFHPKDIRYDAGKQGGYKSVQERSGEVKQLGQARSSRRAVIYTLKRIIEDTATGAPLRGRFKALVTS